jgi:sugar fermentation stimulation protein A
MFTFPTPLVHGRLIRRYNRFLADVQLDDGTRVTAHCTNSGSMKSCLETGAEVYLSPANNPARKTPYTWEMILINDDWVGINTNIPNQLAFLGLKNDLIPGLTGFSQIKREVRFGDSRFDLYAQGIDEACFIEVKNVTLNEDGMAQFPDAVTLRGQKHLDTLVEVKKAGMRAVMLYVIQRTDVKVFGPARNIDPEYARKLKRAAEHGVEIIPWQVKVSPEGIIPVGILDITGL